MKNILSFLPILLTAIFLVILSFLPTNAWAEVEIDLGDSSETKPAPATPVSTATPVPKKAAEVEMNDEEDEDEEEAYEEKEKPAPTATRVPVVTEVRGVMKMRDYYEAGIKSYKAEEYQQAIRYLEQALLTKDPYTKDYYYAEANAMLGVIYHFYFTIPGSRAKAYRYYSEALRIDPETETAKKYRNQVRPR